MEFDEFVQKKQTRIKKYRKYELKYPENTELIIQLLKQCMEKEDTHDNRTYSYLSIAEYLYFEKKQQQVSIEGLRKIVARIAYDNELELN